jgi:hypothetical protein
VPKLVESFEDAEESVLNLVLEQAQVRLSQQIELAVAADQRSYGLLAVLSGFSAAAFSTAITTNTAALSVGAGVAGALWGAGALSAVVSMNPIGVHAPGWPPSWVAADVRARKGYRRIVSEVIAQLDVMIAENRRVMQRNAAWTRAAMAAMVAAPFVGLLAALISLASFAAWAALI